MMFNLIAMPRRSRQFEEYDEWDSMNCYTIRCILDEHLGIGNVTATLLLDYVKSHPTTQKFDDHTLTYYTVNGSWITLADPERLKHFLYIDAKKGLCSDWIPNGKSFAGIMEETKDKSLKNLYTFLHPKDQSSEDLNYSGGSYSGADGNVNEVVVYPKSKEDPYRDLMPNGVEDLKNWDKRFQSQWGELP